MAAQPAYSAADWKKNGIVVAALFFYQELPRDSVVSN
jgi:hypothetical protein